MKSNMAAVTSAQNQYTWAKMKFKYFKHLGKIIMFNQEAKVNNSSLDGERGQHLTGRRH